MLPDSVSFTLRWLKVYGSSANYQRGVWKRLAYTARYGHQDVDVMLAKTSREFALFYDSLADLVQAENKSGQGYNEKIAGGGG